jgi:hypothetical protein
MLYAHTRHHNASTNADCMNEVCRLRLSMRHDYPQPERLVITWRSADKVLLLKDIAHISSLISLYF